MASCLRSCIYTPEQCGVPKNGAQQADGTLTGCAYRRLLAGFTNLVLLLLCLLVPSLCSFQRSLVWTSPSPLSPEGRSTFPQCSRCVSQASADTSSIQLCLAQSSTNAAQPWLTLPSHQKETSNMRFFLVRRKDSIGRKPMRRLP